MDALVLGGGLGHIEEFVGLGGLVQEDLFVTSFYFAALSSCWRTKECGGEGRDDFGFVEDGELADGVE